MNEFQSFMDKAKVMSSNAFLMIILVLEYLWDVPFFNFSINPLGELFFHCNSRTDYILTWLSGMSGDIPTTKSVYPLFSRRALFSHSCK